MKINLELDLDNDNREFNERELSLATGIVSRLLEIERKRAVFPKGTLDKVMRLYNAARRNRDKGGRLKEPFAGRCEGIAMTLSKLGYRIVKQGDTCVALPTAECDAETLGEGKRNA